MPEVLALADGVELIGEFEGSGFREPPLLARRADGQMVRLTRLLYEIAAASDGRRDAGSVAAVVTERLDKDVSAENVGYLADARLRPQGVLALADGTTPELPQRHATPELPSHANSLDGAGDRLRGGDPRLLAIG